MRAVQVGDIISERYELVRLLGGGSQGRVFVALQHPLGREVALKIVTTGHIESTVAERQERFQLEAEALARLSHPCCVQVFDFGVWEGRPYLVMELLQGVPLSYALRGEPWPIPRAVHVASQIARGLSHAHAAGIIHRDLSPRNVMLLQENEDENGIRVKLVDFGLARMGDERALTHPGQLIGTPSYMPPERVRGQLGGPQTDTYAVGVMLFEMLTGGHPLRRSSPAMTIAAIVDEGMPSLLETTRGVQFPPELVALVDACTHRDPSSRPADGTALRRRLASVQTSSIVLGAEQLGMGPIASELTHVPNEPPEMAPVINDGPARPRSTPSMPAPVRQRSSSPPMYLFALLGAIGLMLVVVAVLLTARLIGAF